MTLPEPERTPGGFGERVRDHLARVEAVNDAVLDEVAGLLLEVVRRDALVYVAGTGHSVALVLETFYRAGGLACVVPLYHPGLLPLHGGGASTRLERTPGLAATILSGVRASERDLGVVFSNSGSNPVPVELAEGLRATGTPVVAVVSVLHMRAAPPRAGRRLSEMATHVVDTLVPPGDASHPPGAPATAPLSSLVSVFVWNLLLARLADRAAAAGVDLPLWSSANVAGGDERNRGLADRFRGRVPLL